VGKKSQPPINAGSLKLISAKGTYREFEARGVPRLEFRISNETNPGAQSLLINESLKEWHELDTRGVVALKTLERDPAS
jgi:hypothetical protein